MSGVALSLTERTLASSERAIQAMLKDRIAYYLERDDLDENDLTVLLENPGRYTDVSMAVRALEDIKMLRDARARLKAV